VGGSRDNNKPFPQVVLLARPPHVALWKVHAVCPERDRQGYVSAHQKNYPALPGNPS